MQMAVTYELSLNTTLDIRRYFRIVYIQEEYFWEDGIFQFSRDIREGIPCTREIMRVTDD